jgi:hypothetical protein
MELSSSAVAMAICRSIPNEINTGIRIKAAPTPAMVRSAVKTSVIAPAIAKVTIFTLSLQC